MNDSFVYGENVKERFDHPNSELIVPGKGWK